MALSNSEKLTYSTARIECEMSETEHSVGTGFFYSFSDNEGSPCPVLITNKHVVKEAKYAIIYLNRMSNKGEPIDNSFVRAEINPYNIKIDHPREDVDLCAIPIGPLLNQAKKDGEMLFYLPINEDILPTTEQLEELGAVEDVLMIGYPSGIWDAHNNKPIVRKGMTATHPNLNYNGREEFMIDAAVFTGSSGSPVFIFNQGGYVDKHGTTNMGGNRIILLGCLYAGPVHDLEGRLSVAKIPTTQEEADEIDELLNLGNVIKAERIKELENTFREQFPA